MSHNARTFRKTFSKRLREARELRGLDQSELARRLGLKPSSISHFESGRRVPGVETVICLGDILNVPVTRLLGRDEEVGAIGPGMHRLMQAAAKLKERDILTVIALAENLAARE